MPTNHVHTLWLSSNCYQMFLFSINERKSCCTTAIYLNKRAIIAKFPRSISCSTFCSLDDSTSARRVVLKYMEHSTKMSEGILSLLFNIEIKRLLTLSQTTNMYYNDRKEKREKLQPHNSKWQMVFDSRRNVGGSRFSKSRNTLD